MPHNLSVSSFSLVRDKRVLCSLTFLIALFAHMHSVSAQSRLSGQPLKVEIISPRDGEVVRGTISIEARVSDPPRVQFVQFFIQEPGAKDRYGWQAYSPPYYWGGNSQKLDTTLFDDGLASAVAFSYPKDTQFPVEEHRVHFTVDNGKPTVRILSPRHETEIAGDVVIEVNAEDPRGITKPPGIAEVRIYLDGGLYIRLRDKPYRARLETCLLSHGMHSIRAVAEDSEGLTTTASILFGVNPNASITSIKP